MPISPSVGLAPFNLSKLSSFTVGVLAPGLAASPGLWRASLPLPFALPLGS